MNSPALNYSLLDLSLSVNDMRERKMAEESISGNPEEEIKTEDCTQEVYFLFINCLYFLNVYYICYILGTR